jgi:hypothetical protein
MKIKMNIDVLRASQKEERSIGKVGKPKKLTGLNQPPKNNNTVINDIRII